MDIDSFIKYFNGRFDDFDGALGDQCFDLANSYSRWIGGQSFTGATADLIFNQTQNGFYSQIHNDADNFPQKGDIVVWDWPHVGIATGNNTDSKQFEVIEQNDPLNSNCHLKVYNYDGVIGWLRPLNLPQSQTIITDQLRLERDKNWNLYEDQLKTNQGKDDRIKELETQVNDKITEISNLTADLQTCKTQLESSLAVAKKLNDEDLQAISQSLDAQHERDTIKGQIIQIMDALQLSYDKKFPDVLAEIIRIKADDDKVNQEYIKLTQALNDLEKKSNKVWTVGESFKLLILTIKEKIFK